MQFVTLLQELGIRMLNVSGGSHLLHTAHATFSARRCFHRPTAISRPKTRLSVCARQIEVGCRDQEALPRHDGRGHRVLLSVRSICRTWLNGQVRTGRTDSVGLGRVVLSYPDAAAGRSRQRLAGKRNGSAVTFSDLHDGTAQRDDLGMLPARSLLPQVAGGGGDQAGQGGVSLVATSLDTRIPP